jgi:hypothetical protein
MELQGDRLVFAFEHGQFFLAISNAHDERVMADLVVKEGAEPYPEDAGNLQERPQGRINVIFFDFPEEIHSKAAPG